MCYSNLICINNNILNVYCTENFFIIKEHAWFSNDNEKDTLSVPGHACRRTFSFLAINMEKILQIVHF